MVDDPAAASGVPSDKRVLAPGEQGKYPSLLVLLLRARMAMEARFVPILRGLGLSEQQFRILVHLLGDERLELSKVAARLDFQIASLSRMFRNLEERGLVYRVHGQRDGRQVILALTEEGREATAQAWYAIVPMMEEIRRLVGEDRVEGLQHELSHLVEVLNADLPDVPGDV